MSARILDGEVIAQSIKEEIATRTISRVDDGHRPPGLAIILVGDDPSSHVYVRLKKKDCEMVGFHTEIRLFDESASEHEVISCVQSFNRNENIDGIVQTHFDLRPGAIIRDLDLRRPIYKQTASYGHFGRTDLDLPWERTNKSDEIRKYAGL